MPVNKNENNIENINYIDDDQINEIITAKYNDKTVFDKSVMVNYTFPNEQVKIIYKGASIEGENYGFTALQDTSYSTAYDAWHSFIADTSVKYYFWGTYGKTSNNNYGHRFGLSFPFDVYLKQINIRDSETVSQASGYYSYLRTGTIYVDDIERASTTITDTNIPTNVWGTIDRTVGDDTYSAYKALYSSASLSKNHITSHTSSENYNSPIRCFVIDGTFGGQTYNTIGQVTVNFNVRLSDLLAWAEKYGLDPDTLGYTVIE